MRKLSFQKIFCFLSFLFILSCCIFYGVRFTKLYLENKKEEIIEKNSLFKVLKENNSENENFKTINGINYFTGKDDNNYLSYAGIIWRIIKVNADNSLTVISNNAITSLAYSKTDEFNNSEIFKWLNKSDKEYSGVLENALNLEYLQKVESCTDSLDELENNPCQKTNTNNYFTLLSVVDYLNIGSKDSYLANDESFYLSNMTSDNKVWYIDNEGNGKMGTGNEIIGIRPVINIKANIDYVTGNGKKDNPYIVEKENSLFGSYVKLGKDIWRIYEVNDNTIKLMLNDYLKVDNNNLSYKYSTNTSYHNDTISGSIAYYLNHDYLNSLSYKDIVKETKWSNGYYNSATNFDYTNSLKEQVDTKVALLSIGNIILNPDLSNYYLMTGSTNRGSSIYVIPEDKKAYTKHISSNSFVIPTISIDKTLLKKGNGTSNSPFEME